MAALGPGLALVEHRPDSSSERSSRARSWSAAGGCTSVCESACTAYRPPPKTLGNSVMENGIFAVWKVEISHSPWKKKPACPVAKVAIAPW